LEDGECNILKNFVEFAFRPSKKVSEIREEKTEGESVGKLVEMDHETTIKKVETVGEETLQELEGGKMASEVKKIEEQQTELTEGKNKMVVNENNPVLHYWKDEECRPLVHPSDATSLG
jgi:UDP-N-acetylglucosamine pyrophosphorylase